MKANQIVKGKRYYSKSFHRIVYFTGVVRFDRFYNENIYEFVDICDAFVDIKESRIASDIEEY